MRLLYRCITSCYRYIAYCLLKLTSECTEALSVSVEDWVELQGEDEESTVDRGKLADERKARFTATQSTDAI